MLYSFPPVVSPDARVLVLGSMPGVRSLELQQYYAHPQNGFWRIMAGIIDLDIDGSYEQRIEALRANKVALWDVLSSCERVGSLDSDIRPESIQINNFESLLKENKSLTSVFFNGRKSQQLFERYVVGKVPAIGAMTLQYLPSTSPAHASLSFEKKLLVWKEAFDASFHGLESREVFLFKPAQNTL